MSLTVSLSAAKLGQLIKEERARCTSLGVQLDIPVSQLQDLQRNFIKPNTECFIEMWQKWFQEIDEDRKWYEVYEALEQQGNRRLKADLEKKHKADTKGNASLTIVF